MTTKDLSILPSKTSSKYSLSTSNPLIRRKQQTTISLRQGKRTVEEYLAEFRLLISLAGMTADTTSNNIHLINYFQQGLNPAIAKKVALSDNVPTTIAEWSD